MKLVRHPNVVRLHAVLASRTKIYIILEFITGGELFDKIVHHVRLSEAESRRFFQQLIDGVEYCHSKGPENLLLDSQGNLKISDFGLSALPAEGVSNLQTTCGTLNYVAPELITGSEAQGLQWCFGGCMVMWGHLICTDGKDTSHLMKCFSPHCIIRSRKLNFHAHHFSPVGAKSLIHRILDPNPETRICIEEIRNDEWFKKNYVPARVVEYEDVNLDYVNAVFDDSEEERGDEQEIDEDAGHAL